MKVIIQIVHSCKECDHSIHVDTDGYADRLNKNMNAGGVVSGKWYCDLARRRDEQERGLVHFHIEDPHEIPEDICPRRRYFILQNTET
jgi:hypothetical protein